MFDNRLKELREKQGLSMSKVASDLGIPVQTYSNYEKDLREPTAMVLIRIANYFNASLDYLLDNTDHKKIILLPHSEQEDKLMQLLRILDDTELLEVQSYVHYLEWKKNNN